MTFAFLIVALWPPCDFWRCENTSQSFVEAIHRVFWIIGAHVDDRVFAAGGFFHDVCGSSLPVSAV